MVRNVSKDGENTFSTYCFSPQNICRAMHIAEGLSWRGVLPQTSHSSCCPLQPQSISISNPLTALHALGDKKLTMRNNGLCSTFMAVITNSPEWMSWWSGRRGHRFFQWPLNGIWNDPVGQYILPEYSGFLKKIFHLFSYWTVSVWTSNTCNKSTKPNK